MSIDSITLQGGLSLYAKFENRTQFPFFFLLFSNSFRIEMYRPVFVESK